jgi:tryptophan synthase beta chain
VIRDREGTCGGEPAPEAWYNIAADLPESARARAATRHGGADRADDLAPLFPMEVILQEVSSEERIEIPEEVREVYRANGGRRRSSCSQARARCSTHSRADLLQVPRASPTGATKPTPRSAQAFYNAQGRGAGVERLATETRAGQVGLVLAFAGRALRGSRSRRVHGAVSRYEQKPYRRAPDGGVSALAVRAEPLRGDRAAGSGRSSPSTPTSTGSLGIASLGGGPSRPSQSMRTRRTRFGCRPEPVLPAPT